MKIVILTYGSRGDVQPFLPLSLRLMQRGHSVILAAPARFKNLVEEYGITFFPLPGDPEELSRRLNNAGYNFIKQVGELTQHALEIAAEMLHQTEEAAHDADLIIHTFTHAMGAHTLAREKNIPDIHIQTFPMFAPTGDYPNITLPNLGYRFLNRLSHIASLKITELTSRLAFEQVRRRAGLPKRKLYFPFINSLPRPQTQILCAWSPSLIPPSSDWGSHVHVTGYYFFPYDNSYVPPNELKAFLESGKPPVCISFGSMVNKNAEKIDGIIRDTLKRTDNRGIILSGWGSMKGEISSGILYLDSAPHDWLLPKCKLMIHHGGAGTISAGLRAGIPQVVVPFMADQPFWGGRVHAIGVGSSPIFLKKLSVEKMVSAMAEAESKVTLERAQAAGQLIRGEDGVGHAIKLIEHYVAEFNASI